MSEAAWNGTSIRNLERTSIRAFLERHRRYFRDRVLDYGCGDQRYAGIVRATGAQYVPFDRAAFRDANVTADVGEDSLLQRRWPTILSTQVITVVDDPAAWLASVRHMLAEGGVFVMTYNTNWDEVGDLWRFTKIGMELLLEHAGFEILVHERRAAVTLGDFEFPLGYGTIVRTT